MRIMRGGQNRCTTNTPTHLIEQVFVKRLNRTGVRCRPHLWRNCEEKNVVAKLFIYGYNNINVKQEKGFSNAY